MLIIGLMNFDKIYNLFAGNEDSIKLLLLQKKKNYIQPFIKCLKMSIVRYKLNVARIKQKAESGVKMVIIHMQSL